ncbi:hypothetical protein BCR32DRAFT_280190 [Anaeromyces robustus]|uniref:Uncharacterized protein n=1 Tax=Anaeromyces robustus TaxID=1754192 RepID=A0A1Y1X5G1_9FUNG|nr:hypothetical protein BCR32DRAFT_280190 [Anaeromyces robustus]|eukprot:ORX80885.1 hypothetical protein BCR32DRAFT_280190 [Anaeromyces robustus]
MNISHKIYFTSHSLHCVQTNFNEKLWEKATFCNTEIMENTNNAYELLPIIIMII